MMTQNPSIVAGLPPTVLTVSELNRSVAGLLQRTFPLLTVRGELSNFTRASSGHWYFSLKDAQAQVRAVMFKGRAQWVDWVPRDGERVEIRATVTMYEPRGEFQLSVESMRRAGVGDLYAEFIRLKEKLAAEGLFAPEQKKPLPRYPRRVGVMTSPQAAALRDVLSTLARRAPHLPVVLYPVPVQGAPAASALCSMLKTIQQRAEIDVLLVVRGGGSIEDLWAFNDEDLARQLAASSIPVITGIGHETDFTLADFAASQRAATPTAAAELCCLALREIQQQCTTSQRQLQLSWERQCQQWQQRLDGYQRELGQISRVTERWRWRLQAYQQRLPAALTVPYQRQQFRLQRFQEYWQRVPGPQSQRQALQTLTARWQAAIEAGWQRHQQRLQQQEQALTLLNPQHILRRGYVLVYDDRGRLITTAAAAQGEAHLQLQFADNTLAVRVQQQSAS
ncbi:exodeoxyribonuclease VII large subunit [Parvibium lacunae]|uniref:Exodeoxyribonuclease 7 large subunit n=1 Tax=Parvibium lacunae TaxID=1888893 RepID=A0A368L4I0_9BURK|nr:exodeoxyribonuclease VII large subunit [Parvibium lacunae]RCS58491.1 exodeoxyribonuclease VII large subunit [Parvibium lacunae]